METTLKPCPFCGHASEYCDIIDGVRYPYCVTPDCVMNLENPDEHNWNTRAPTPREQELEAQNKALWELVGHVDALLAADERGQGIGYAEAIQRCAKTLAAIQKAKEAKV
jgi:hypothetical protein